MRTANELIALQSSWLTEALCMIDESGENISDWCMDLAADIVDGFMALFVIAHWQLTEPSRRAGIGVPDFSEYVRRYSKHKP
jgi:hypothetical protein